MKPTTVVIFVVTALALSGKVLGSAVVLERQQPFGPWYSLKWQVYDNNTVQFQVKAKTTGWVGFGLARSNHGMDGADIVIGGIFENGTKYFQDYHGVGNGEPVVDEQQDWKAVKISEQSGWTMMTFRRQLDSCDVQGDIPIDENSLNILFAVGKDDTLDFHGDMVGHRRMYLLDPPQNSLESENHLKSWDIHIKATNLPSAVDTIYWCTMHESPVLNKSHVVGFEHLLPSTNAKQHTHHLILHRCLEPMNVNRSLWPENEGDQCYSDGSEFSKLLLSGSCGTFYYVWFRGAEDLYLPENVGFPMGHQDENIREYFVLEAHFDYPDLKLEQGFEVGVTLWYTEEPREFDAGILFMGTKILDQGLVIPPKVENYVVAGHCSPKCTEESFPVDGINAFSVLLHTHNKGQKVRLRHLREDQELPWLSSDAHYDHSHPENRMLRNPVKIAMGDHLIVECHYNTQQFENATTGGLSTTRNEMCLAVMLYYPLMEDFGLCMSSPLDSEKPDMFEMLGLDVDTSNTRNVSILGPRHVTGLSLEDALNLAVDWEDQDLVNQLQLRTLYGKHDQICTKVPHGNGTVVVHDVTIETYPPGLVPYVSESVCKVTESGNQNDQFVEPHQEVSSRNESSVSVQSDISSNVAERNAKSVAVSWKPVGGSLVAFCLILNLLSF